MLLMAEVQAMRCGRVSSRDEDLIDGHLGRLSRTRHTLASQRKGKGNWIKRARVRPKKRIQRPSTMILCCGKPQGR